jgi:hypothetical protein
MEYRNGIATIQTQGNTATEGPLISGSHSHVPYPLEAASHTKRFSMTDAHSQHNNECNDNVHTDKESVFSLFQDSCVLIQPHRVYSSYYSLPIPIFQFTIVHYSIYKESIGRNNLARRRPWIVGRL